MPVFIGGKRVMDKPNDLVSAKKLLEYLNGNPDGYISDVCYEGLKERIERGDFTSDPIPLPTIKPGNTRQLLLNTIKAMTDKQVEMVAKHFWEVVE